MSQNLIVSCLQISLLYITNLKEFMGFSGSQSDGRGWVDPQEKDSIIIILITSAETSLHISIQQVMNGVPTGCGAFAPSEAQPRGTTGK